LHFLSLVGLTYINLDRLVHTLSAGEAQRVRLAAVIGSELRDLTVLLDEPTRGLHASEVDALGDALASLVRLGNTVVVVEHDASVIRRADHVIEIGPGSGADGGRVVASGAPKTLKKGVTARLLGGKIKLPAARQRRTPKDWIVVREPRGNNLRADEVRLPLGVLGGVCGVSGSGKSTLLVDTVGRALAPGRATATWSSGPTTAEPHERIEAPPLKVVMMDQSHRGVQSPGAHLGVITALRKRYAEHDSAAVETCDACGGGGVINVDMMFLSPISHICDDCDGGGYTRLAHDVQLRGLSLPDLELCEIDDVLERWSDAIDIARPLEAASRLGLGYLTLRQPQTALSGGECQRLRLADAISRKRQATPRLFVLDEPTVGLHTQDVSALVTALDAIVDGGDGVLVVEHHTGLLACCDWLVELDEGLVVGNGTPEDIARTSTPTAPYLAEWLT
jgi:excinuclease ABC subunit A